MSVLEPMRPAARSAVVRPHSSSLPSPRPASAATCCSASLFFVSPPQPVGKQSYWVASPCSHFGWEQLADWERVGEQECTAFSDAYAAVPTVPMLARVRVMRARAGVCSPSSLSLGTWKHLLFFAQYQRLVLFPRLFPAPRRVGTWEHGGAAPPRSGWLRRRSNKVEAGNGDLQRAAAGARRKFRAPIARLVAAGDLELGRIRELATRRSDNGGKPRFSACLAGHVGRPMLEGLRQAADLASFPAPCRKLGRLRGSAQGELTLLGRSRHPRAPNRGRRSAAMLALHAGRIWIESPFRAGLLDDWLIRSVGKNARIGDRRRGPGGICFSRAAEKAARAHVCEAGKRAGVNPPAAIARPHDAGENRKLRRDFAAVNGGSR